MINGGNYLTNLSKILFITFITWAINLLSFNSGALRLLHIANEVVAMSADILAL
jgi:hypothetical protein